MTQIKRSLILLLIVAAIFTLPGCQKKPNAYGQKLANVGKETADNLAAYYEALARDALDSWQMLVLYYGSEEFYDDEDDNIEKLDIAVEDIGKVKRSDGCKDECEEKAENEAHKADVALRREYQSILHSLNMRILLARRISAAYQALNDLSSYDATAELAAAGRDLGEAIGSIEALPGSTVAPAELFALAGAELGSALQSKDIKKGAQALSQLVRDVACLFEMETKDYKWIEEERRRNAINLCRSLLNGKLVTGAPMAARITDMLGLSPIDKEKLLSNKSLTHSTLEIAIMNAELMCKAAMSATQGTLASLYLLGSSGDYMNRGTANTVLIQNALQKTKFYLAEMSKIRGK